MGCMGSCWGNLTLSVFPEYDVGESAGVVRLESGNIGKVRTNPMDSVLKKSRFVFLRAYIAPEIGYGSESQCRQMSIRLK